MKNKIPLLPLDMNALLDRYPPDGQRTPSVKERPTPPQKKPNKLVSVAVSKTSKVDFASMIDLYPIEPKKEAVDLNIARNQPRNNLRVERELDLHGDTLKEAEYAVEIFLNRCYHERVRCVRVIHGKGKHSKTGTAVLKHHLQSTLDRHPLVLKTTGAGFHDGQGGATIVILKTNYH